MTFQLYEEIEVNVITPEIIHIFIVINILQMLHNHIS